MIQHSESIGKVVAAIAAVQREVGHVTKGAVNPHFGNSYADLNTFLHALSEPMANNGLTLIQGPGQRDGWVTVDTKLVHESGEWISSEAGSPMPKADPQGAGSAITYLRRYSLAALFALPQEDDDGNAASSVGRDASGQKREAPKAAKGAPTCPTCGSGVWDNRTDKRNPKAPDWKCKSKTCDWALWLTDAREKLSEALDGLVSVGVVTPEQMQRCMDGTSGGDLAALRIAQDWVNTKREEGRLAGAPS